MNTICIGLVRSAQIDRRAKDGDLEAHYAGLAKRVPLGRVAHGAHRGGAAGDAVIDIKAGVQRDEMVGGHGARLVGEPRRGCDVELAHTEARVMAQEVREEACVAEDADEELHLSGDSCLTAKVVAPT